MPRRYPVRSQKRPWKMNLIRYAVRKRLACSFAARALTSSNLTVSEWARGLGQPFAYGYIGPRPGPNQGGENALVAAVITIALGDLFNPRRRRAALEFLASDTCYAWTTDLLELDYTALCAAVREILAQV